MVVHSLVRMFAAEYAEFRAAQLPHQTISALYLRTCPLLPEYLICPLHSAAFCKDKTVFERTGVKHFWIIENSLDFLDSIKEVKTDFMESYDFSTLYTNLPHANIKEAFKKLFKLVFSREAKSFIIVNMRKAFFSNQQRRNYASFNEKDMNRILHFILDNIYVKFGNDVYKQKVGIPIGLDSGQDIANLLLYYFEREYLLALTRSDLNTAKKFCHTFRYIDDLFSAAFRQFSNHLQGFIHLPLL